MEQHNGLGVAGFKAKDASRLIKKAESVVGCKLLPLEEQVEIGTLKENQENCVQAVTSAPQNDVEHEVQLQTDSVDSTAKERYKKSFLPAAISLFNSVKLILFLLFVLCIL